MIKLIPAAEHHNANVGDWLQSHYLFSFADYYDPANVQFGPLRVFNHDRILGHNGFPLHPHAEMEVVSVVLDGELTHKDSLGNEVTLKAGDVQRMTSGTGFTHSENNDTDNETELLQLWFLPNKRGLAPSYEHMSLDFLDTKNKLVPLVTGQKVLENIPFINSNSTVYYGHVGQGEEIDFKTFKIRKTLVYVLSGSMLVNNVEAEKYDQVRLESKDVVSLHGNAEATFILVDVPAAEVNY
ncbi:pirin family protein [Pontibacter anaerobius]|uniref:Pirin family protein n=1 Tax=Pontibacter anaerobius TaxID=2993940 RepID=A0ABT3RCK3_9BACT|nr:pirin-like bicupin family protein [Pontibacter anaerobius]MCX2739143.1 pirin family protein [Pontibacter anaerobius]